MYNVHVQYCKNTTSVSHVHCVHIHVMFTGKIQSRLVHTVHLHGGGSGLGREHDQFFFVCDAALMYGFQLPELLQRVFCPLFWSCGLTVVDCGNCSSCIMRRTPTAPRLNERSASETPSLTINRDTNIVLGHRFHIWELNASFAFYVMLRQQRSNFSSLVKSSNSATSSLAISADIGSCPGGGVVSSPLAMAH